MGKRKRKATVTQRITAEATEQLSGIKHDATRKQYIRHFKSYVRYCRDTHNVKFLEDCQSYVQDYCDNLVSSGKYSASTVHTYIAAICRVLNINMRIVKKPIRHVADYVRGRTERFGGATYDENDPRWSYVVEFQKRVGIRRNELEHLRGCDFATDESNYPCVLVRCGKGGKIQYQRIDVEDIEFVRQFFTRVEKDDYIFEKSLFQNNLNLHGLRADCAKKYYADVLKRLKEDPKYAKQLEGKIRKRWDLYCRDKKGRPRRFPEHEIRGWYILRGKNREMARRKGLPVSYNKLALMATSIFKLSHWRNDVTVASYLLA